MGGPGSGGSRPGSGRKRHDGPIHDTTPEGLRDAREDCDVTSIEFGIGRREANHFARQAKRYWNEARQAMVTLSGLVTGLIADRQLNDEEILFLREWIVQNDSVAYEPPGDVVCDLVRDVLADGVITDHERIALMDVLQRFTGAQTAPLSSQEVVNDLVFDDVAAIDYPGHIFCLTGNFEHYDRSDCEQIILDRGGVVTEHVSGKVHYVVVGNRGSAEWKHRGYGTKLVKAMALKRAGALICVVREDAWASLL